MGRSISRFLGIIRWSLSLSLALVMPANAQFTQQGDALTSSSMPNDEFGQSVSISRDGNTAIVGARGELNRAGGAWILTRAGSPPVWSVAAHLTGGSFPRMIGNAWAGYSVAMSANGNFALVGAPQDNNGEGAAWVFHKSGVTQWALSGVKVIHVRPNDGHECFGWSVGLDKDGKTAVIGAPDMEINISKNEYVYHSGVAYVYSISGSGGVLQAALDAGSLADNESSQGWSVAISEDGMVALDGGPYDGATDRGAAWIYAKTGPSWGPPKKLGSEFSDWASAGTSVALSGTGDVALVGGPFEAPYGAVRVYGPAGVWNFTGANLVTAILPAGSSQGSQGSSVSIDRSGLTALVGEPSAQPSGLTNNWDDSGRAYLYTMNGSGTWTNPGEMLHGHYLSSTISLDPQGGQAWSVALSASGNDAMSGAVGENQLHGAAWVFTRAPGSAPDLSTWLRIDAPCPGVYSLNSNYTFTATVLQNPLMSTPSFHWSVSSPHHVASIVSTLANTATVSTTPNPPLTTVFGGEQAELCVQATLGGIVLNDCIPLPVDARTPANNLRHALAQMICLQRSRPPFGSLATQVVQLGSSARRTGFTKEDLRSIEAAAHDVAEAARAAAASAPEGRSPERK